MAASIVPCKKGFVKVLKALAHLQGDDEATTSVLLLVEISLHPKMIDFYKTMKSFLSDHDALALQQIRLCQVSNAQNGSYKEGHRPWSTHFSQPQMMPKLCKNNASTLLKMLKHS